MTAGPDIQAHPQYILHGAGNTYEAVHVANLEAQKHHAEFLKVGGRRKRTRRRLRRRRGKSVKNRRRLRHKSRRPKARGVRRKSRTGRMRGGAACGSNSKVVVPSSHATVAGGGPQSFNALSARGNTNLATAKCNAVYDGPYQGWKPIPTT